jgi:hypothetical protein
MDKGLSFIFLLWAFVAWWRKCALVAKMCLGTLGGEFQRFVD